MNGIFISYRRDDAPGYAGRLYDRLAAHFGADHVFMDVQGIEPGVDFVDAIERALGSCEILIVLIGKDWLAADNAGRRRLDDPNDFVRVETATALARGIRVVPVLVEGAVMPRGDSLPTELLPLVRRQAVELSHKQWDATSADLIRTLEKILDRDKPRVAAAQPVERALAGTQPAEPTPRPPPQPVEERRPAGLYWGLVALLLLIAASVVYLTHPWRRDVKPAPSPAVLSVTPEKIEFAEQKLQVAGPASVITITNRGGATLHVGSVRLEGPAAADFALSENQCSRGELAPGASCAMKVIFTPQAAGSRAAKLVIAHDAANAAPTISMQGHGAEPVVAHATPPVDKSSPPPTTPAIAPPERKSEVVAAPPRILRFESRLVDDKVQLCYGVENAASATITPEPGAVKPLAQECVVVAGSARTTYTLSARSTTGVVATRAISVEAAKPPSAQLIAIPDVIGKSRRDAAAELERAGFKVQVVESKPDPKAAGLVDSVVAQSPKGGEHMTAGDRVTLEIMPAPAAVAAIPSGLPHVGDNWQYNFKSMWKNVEPRTFAHQVIAVSDREVRETMSFVANGSKTSESKSFGGESRFIEWRGQGYYFVEFNPFLQAFGALQPGTAWKSLVAPIEDPFFSDWYSQGRAIGWESVSVPAGTFKALRVELNSSRNASANSAAQLAPARIRYVIWYAPDAKRTVKHVRTVLTTDGTRLAEDTYELVKYVVQ